ncbi:MAG: transglutaminase-like cysteine peptidase [Planctomycetota bacterium]
MLERLRLGALRLAFGRRWGRLSFDEAVQRFRTPREVSDFMQVAFEYVTDQEHFGFEEVWQTPVDTFRNRGGDCEDFALFAWHVLRAGGVPAHLFAAFTERTGHAVCVYEEHGRLHTICNEGLLLRGVRRGAGSPRPGAPAARALAESIFPRTWTSCSFVHRLHLLPPEAGLPRRLEPVYRFIRPQGPASPSRRA